MDRSKIYSKQLVTQSIRWRTWNCCTRENPQYPEWNEITQLPFMMIANFTVQMDQVTKIFVKRRHSSRYNGFEYKFFKWKRIWEIIKGPQGVGSFLACLKNLIMMNLCSKIQSNFDKTNFLKLESNCSAISYYRILRICAVFYDMLNFENHKINKQRGTSMWKLDLYFEKPSAFDLFENSHVFPAGKLS